MNRLARPLVVATAGLALLATSGCGGSADETAATPTASATPSATGLDQVALAAVQAAKSELDRQVTEFRDTYGSAAAEKKQELVDATSARLDAVLTALRTALDKLPIDRVQAQADAVVKALQSTADDLAKAKDSLDGADAEALVTKALKTFDTQVRKAIQALVDALQSS